MLTSGARAAHAVNSNAAKPYELHCSASPAPHLRYGLPIKDSDTTTAGAGGSRRTRTPGRTAASKCNRTRRSTAVRVAGDVAAGEYLRGLLHHAGYRRRGPAVNSQAIMGKRVAGRRRHIAGRLARGAPMHVRCATPWLDSGSERPPSRDKPAHFPRAIPGHAMCWRVQYWLSAAAPLGAASAPSTSRASSARVLV
jgi:hypothetical protein